MNRAHRKVFEQARSAILVAHETQAVVAATRARLHAWPEGAEEVASRRRHASFMEEARIEAEHGEALRVQQSAP